MAEISVKYTITELTVTVSAGEIFKKHAGMRDNHMLVALSDTTAAVINTSTGYRTVPAFIADWTVDGKSRTMSLRDLLDSINPGMTYAQFLLSWGFAGSDRLQTILEREADGS